MQPSAPNEYKLRLTLPQIRELVQQISTSEKLLLLESLLKDLQSKTALLSQKEKIRLQLLEVQSLKVFDIIPDASLWQTQIRNEWQ